MADALDQNLAVGVRAAVADHLRRRMDWIDKTISPLPAEAREGFRLSLALAIGPDPVTMLKDVAGLDAERTRRVLKRAERAMLRAAVQLNGRSKGGKSPGWLGITPF